MRLAAWSGRGVGRRALLGVSSLGLVAAALTTVAPAGSADPALAGALSVDAGDATNGAPTPGQATSSALTDPTAVAVDRSGDVYIADTSGNVIEKVDPAGRLAVIAGDGSPGTPTPGPATSSTLDYPYGVAVDRFGDVYIADTFGGVIEKVDPAGNLTIIAGDGSSGPPTPGPATSSGLSQPYGVAVDGSGDVYIADTKNDRIERVDPAGILTIIAGDGSDGAPTPGPATSSGLSQPYGVAVDGSGDVYIADTNNNVIEKVDPAGNLTVVAGDGSNGSPTPGPATSSPLAYPNGVAVDGSGNFSIADTNNHVIEKVDPAGTLSVVAGDGSKGAPTSGPATSSPLAYPNGLAVDGSGNFYIADTNNHVIERVVAQNTQPITFPQPPGGVAGTTATLSATGGWSGNPVTFRVDATSGPGVCSLSGTDGAIVSYLSAGSCVIDANQAGDTDYSAAVTVSVTDPAVTVPPVTNPSVTDPSVTDPSVTDPSVTEVSPTSGPVTGGGQTTSTTTATTSPSVKPPRASITSSSSSPMARIHHEGTHDITRVDPNTAIS